MKTIALTLCLLSTIGLSLSAPQTRVVGGEDAILGQVPYIGSLSVGGSENCGAVIISENYALTLMRCVCSAGSNRPWPPQLFTVLVGTIDLYSGGSRIKVEEIIVNPNYEDLKTGIVLLKLARSLKFSDYIQPIALAKTNPPVNAVVDISGWASTNGMQRTLQVNEATVVTAGECARASGRTDNEVFCMINPRGNGICRGDFGGPAVYQNQLVGISGDSIGECGSMLPDIYTSVASNYEWIIDNME